MSSIFGEDGVDDLFNDNIGVENDQLPSDGEADAGEKLFGDDEDAADADAAGAGEQEGVKVEPKKRAVRNPRHRLTLDTLRGPRGLHTIEHYFKDIKYKGKGYEKDDLNEILRRLQHWGHRMYPNYTFDDVLNNIERLGKKKPLQVHMARYRLGQLDDLLMQDVHRHDNEHNDEDDDVAAEPFDEFDALLGEQIAMSKLAPRTPATNRRNLSTTSSTLVTPSFTHNAIMSTPYTVAASSVDNNDISDYGQPLPPSQPATPSAQRLSAEQMARIAENRRLAQERLRAKQMEASAAEGATAAAAAQVT